MKSTERLVVDLLLWLACKWLPGLGAILEAEFQHGSSSSTVADQFRSLLRSATLAKASSAKELSAERSLSVVLLTDEEDSFLARISET